MHKYQYILVAVDFSPGSKLVAHRAAELAQRDRSKLGLIHVIKHQPLVLEVQGILEELHQEADETLRTLASEIGFADAKVWVTVGSPKQEISHIAQEQSIDLIVIGSHIRKGINQLDGSIAKGVMHLSPCDVLTIHVDA